MLYCKAAYYLEKMTGDLPNFAYMYGITKSSETLQKRFEDFVIFLFIQRSANFSSLKLIKEKTEKIRDVTKYLYDVCKVDNYKDFLKLFYFIIKYLPIDQAGHYKISGRSKLSVK